MKATRQCALGLAAASLALSVAGLAPEQTELQRLALELPPAFAWGAATAAYQIEGGASSGGRRASIWDTFSHTPGKTYHGETGDVACDHYHKFKADIALLQSLGLRHYRLSVSWSRLLPDGRGKLNKAGVAFYTEILEELRRVGIEPLVTLYHWDLPQALEDEYGGWLDRRVIPDFAAFADACFEAFAPYVHTWLTFNEALTFVGEGYGDGVHAPGRCSDRKRCAYGDSQNEPLLVAHNVLLAHGAAVAKFRQRFASQSEQIIGMTNCGWMAWPVREDAASGAAAEDFMEATWAWFFDPVIFGDYPNSIKERVGAKAMPKFTDEEQMLLKGSIDFLGVNYYTARWLAQPDETHAPAQAAQGIPYLKDRFHVATVNDKGQQIGDQAGSEWLYVAPRGIHDVLLWLDERYTTKDLGKKFPFKITENGLDQPAAMDETFEMALNDTYRIAYLESHIREVVLAHRDGVAVDAYYAWSLMDNYEWADGYAKRFGLVYVNYTTQERTPKASAAWYSALAQSRPDTLRLSKPSAKNTLALSLGGAVLALLGMVAAFRHFSPASRGMSHTYSEVQLQAGAEAQAGVDA
ncbi:glycoside hydrolase superfamily [Pelagophyceae sp. CCMP2097]|nr:glycoside hydrolase superfamily [Pelagophyceae sp. CCMP2097]|mmetsp:Transcript_30036/g.101266  ORF Transcript_30036/g.101266 Transcript_30036/m.101266 type:complete len:580 (-) Transcript_30036:145-1884(-)